MSLRLHWVILPFSAVTQSATAPRSGHGSAWSRRKTPWTASCTVRENLLVYGRYFGLPRKLINERTDQLLDFVQLTERADDQVDPLSGGMKRRLTIARSLINDPDILILDEPTTGLDPQARHVVWDRLFRLKQRGVTLILTTHYMDEAEQLCDRLVVMDHGKIAAEGTPRELIAQYSTAEVLELRFAPGQQEDAVEKIKDLSPERMEVTADRLLLYAADGDEFLARVHAGGPRAAHRAGPPVHARGRLPAPDRPDPGRLMSGRRRRQRRARRAYRRRALPKLPGSWATVRPRVPLLAGDVPADLAVLGLVVGVRPAVLPGRDGLRPRLARRQERHRGRSAACPTWSSSPPRCSRVQAMNSGLTNAMFPVFGGIHWNKIYLAARATMLRPVDIYRGHLLFITMRIAMNSACFVVVMAAFGLIRSCRGRCCCCPPRVLLGVAFATPSAAWAVTLEHA